MKLTTEQSDKIKEVLGLKDENLADIFTPSEYDAMVKKVTDAQNDLTELRKKKTLTPLQEKQWEAFDEFLKNPPDASGKDKNDALKSLRDDLTADFDAKYAIKEQNEDFWRGKAKEATVEDRIHTLATKAEFEEPEIVVELLKKYVAVEEKKDGEKVIGYDLIIKDSNGKARYNGKTADLFSLDDLVDEFKNKYPKMVKGHKPSGSGASGGDASGKNLTQKEQLAALDIEHAAAMKEQNTEKAMAIERKRAPLRAAGLSAKV